jgi:uncharacterized protein (AIM24 family)
MATADNEILTANGDGNVVLSGNGAVLTMTAASGDANLEVDTAGLVVAGDVQFAGDLTLTAAPATFSGVATLSPARWSR